MEKTRRHLFYPISLLPQKEKQNQKEKVLLCACVDMMLTDKTFFFFRFYAGYTVFWSDCAGCTVLAVRLVSRLVISTWLQEAAGLTATLLLHI